MAGQGAITLMDFGVWGDGNSEQHTPKKYEMLFLRHFNGFMLRINNIYGRHVVLCVDYIPTEK
jgi:hypothetical protein